MLREEVLQTWTKLKEQIKSSKDNCREKLAACKENTGRLEQKITELNKELEQVKKANDRLSASRRYNYA